MFTIGEFSKATGLTVKTLRFYHEKGVLVPSRVDGGTGYRYYAPSLVETAHVITQLRGLDFSLSEIRGILASDDDEADILEHLERQRQTIQEKLQRGREISHSLQRIISNEKAARKLMSEATYEVEEKSVDSLLIAGVRMKAPYRDCGQGFAKIGKRFGRHINGKPFLLHYDAEYKEGDADFEACMPVKKGDGDAEVSIRELPGGKFATLLHKGPYEDLGRSYAKILTYAKDSGYEIETPTREVYIKGPGMIFKGNPKKYLTEIQLPIKPGDSRV